MIILLHTVAESNAVGLEGLLFVMQMKSLLAVRPLCTLLLPTG